MSRPETETGISAIPIEGMAEVLGTFNTEASCAVYGVLPTALTQVGEIGETLQALDAYHHVSPLRFNVNNQLKMIGKPYLNVVRDPSSARNTRSNWVQRDDSVIGEFALGLSGALLDLSQDTGIPLRAVLGERRRATDISLHSVEARLGILVAILEFDGQDEVFSVADIAKHVDKHAITPPTARNHINAMFDQGILDSRGSMSNRRYSLAAEKPGQAPPREFIDRLMAITAMFAVSSQEAIDNGIRLSEKILYRSGYLPMLIERSFASSTHTGKTR